ncbi:MAG TPA: radical SAM protein [Nitrospirae bacterium]|nr:radical SAM protein [Nitrospirota bacterium]
MKICEIFTSIQGESSYAGLLCHFIRLMGCNLRCLYCDTTYAYYEGEEIAVEDILSFIKSKDCSIRLVEITGGEPLLQPDTPRLIEKLIDEGYKVLVETNGSYSIEVIDKRAVIIMDIKTPGSGMDGYNLIENISYLKPTDELKFVITNRFDYEWSREFCKKYKGEIKSSILFSPSFNHLKPSVLAEWIIEDSLPVRLNLQIHKFIFHPFKRGV